MTNEEYRKEIMSFLEKTKTMNDQKIKAALKWRLDIIDLGKREELIENFKKDMLKYYTSLQNHYAHTFNIDISIKEGEDNYDLGDLYFDGRWREEL